MRTTLQTRVLLGLMLASASSLAYAQASAPGANPAAGEAAAADSTTIGEIVVTAQRRAQSVLSVPMAISAIGGESLAKKGVTNSADLASVVPNLQVSSPYGSTQPNFSLRGISVANEYNSNQASPIGVYVDDVYLAARTSHGMGLFDLDRVEVLRGPQGTLFGRNTTGGAINFITRRPSLNGANGYVQAGYGNFNTFSAQAAAETTFVDHVAGARLALNYEKGDGQIKNVSPVGRDANSVDTLQGRLSFRFAPEDWDINIRAYAGRDRGAQAAVHGLQAFRQGLDFFEVNENRTGLSKTDAEGVAASVAYTISPQAKFTSITSVDGGGQNLQQAADGSPLDVLDINWRSRFSQFSEEARLNYETERLKLVGGVFYGGDLTVTNNTFNIGSVFGPGVDGGFFQHYRQKRTSAAIFIQGDYNLTPKLLLTVGGRYTRDDARYRDALANLFLGGVGAPQVPLATTVPCAGPPGSCAYDPNARFSLKGHNSAPTWRVALSYTFDNGALAYASYNRGYRAGAFNGGGYTSSTGINYIRPEKVDAYELGAKGRFFDRSLVLSAATFYYDYRDQQLQDTRPGPVSFLVNAPQSEVYGAEAEMTFRTSDAITLNGSIGYLHAKYKELTLQGANLAGNDLPFAPRWTAQAGLDWKAGTLGGGLVTFSPNIDYASHQYFSPFNEINAPGSAQINSELAQKAYAKVNASLSWVRDDITIRAWVNNLFERKTYAYGLDLRGAGFPYNFLVPGAPRTYGVSLRKSF